jgi:hypothetical protein
MSDDDDPMHMPALIKSMLDPYVNVMGPRSGPPPKREIETTLLPEIFRPTEPQLAAIGKVTAAWSVMERVMGMAIARLSLAPEFTSLALTKELTANNQIRVLRTLIPLHAERYRTQIASDKLVSELMTLPTKIETLKDGRNVVAHSFWHKKNADTLIAMRTKPLTESKSQAAPLLEKTITQINKLAADIQAMADHLFTLTQLLPAVDEGLHAQSLSLAVQSLHHEILGERPPRPEPSEG